MPVMSAGEIAQRAGGTVIGDASVLATSWAFDSRDLHPGACFVALAGERDGHDFVPAAFDAGAHVALVARPVPGTGSLVHVPNTLTALQAVARSRRRDEAALRVVGVAGSTGKTSTKDLLAAALATRAVYANRESYNNEFGVPITLLNAPAATEIVVAEMGERFPGDLAALCEIARPEVGVVTNVGLAHAEHLGDEEGTARVLAELLEALPTEGSAVLNADDSWSAFLADRTPARVVAVGRSAHADLRVSDVDIAADLTATFRLDGNELHVPLRGEHHVQNAAMAAAVAAIVFDASWDDIGAGLESVNQSKWRMELSERVDDVLVVNDAYNANPDSMSAALRALVHLRERRRRVAVLGDMRELGTHAEDAHAGVGRLAAELGVEVVVGVGDGGAMIASAAGARGVEVHCVSNAERAALLVGDLVQRGDAVLVKASRALGLQRVADALLAEEIAP